MTRPLPPVPFVIIEQASAWLIALREPDASAEVRRGFANWLASSPVHIRAYLEVVALWMDLAHAGRELPRDVAPGDGDEMALRSMVVELPATAKASKPAVSAIPARRTLEYRWAAAAAIVLVVLGGWITWQRSHTSYSAPLGEQRALTLDDGSIVTLDSRASIRIHFSKPRREIDLVRGQALFHVARDTARPFIVRSGAAAVRAVGTEFDVFRKTGATVVTVMEGRVRVNAAAPWSAEPSSEAREMLSAGQQLTVTRDGKVGRNDHADIAAATSWLRHELYFDDVPLGDVVEAFNQYTRKPIVVADPALAALHINAVLHSTQPDSFLRYVKHLEGVEVEESSSEIRISRQTRR